MLTRRVEMRNMYKIDLKTTEGDIAWGMHVWKEELY